MATLFQNLIAAIIDDDRAAVQALLKKDPSLVVAHAEQERLETTLPHWIYVGDTALHAAAAGHRVEIARLLLKAGADVRSAQNRRASQPLHYAADGCLDNAAWSPERQVKTINLLIESGAELHARDKNGATALHRAVRTRCAAAAIRLLDLGADPTLKNEPGSTVFHLAVQNTGRGGSGSDKAITAQREIIQALLARSFSPKLKDGKGKTVLQSARSEWIRELLTR